MYKLTRLIIEQNHIKGYSIHPETNQEYEILSIQYTHTVEGFSETNMINIKGTMEFLHDFVDLINFNVKP